MNGRQKAEAWVKERSRRDNGGPLYLSQSDMESLAELLDTPCQACGHKSPEDPPVILFARCGD